MPIKYRKRRKKQLKQAVATPTKKEATQRKKETPEKKSIPKKKTVKKSGD